MAAEQMLEVRGLTKHYPVTRGVVFRRQIAAVRALDGVDLDLRAGETLGVVGESGCGKSTLARLLLAIEGPTAGVVRFQGEDMARMPAAQLRRLRREVQIVFQDPYTSLDPRMTVGDIIAEPMEIHREAVPRGDRRRRVQELLEMVGLDAAHVSRYPHQFSGGQRQRIGIARALALRPTVLICDEPVSALDVSVQAQVINLLDNLRREFHLSCLFISHDLSVVRHIADRVAVMYLGKVVETGSESDIYEHPTHPYTQALLSAIPVPDPSLKGSRARLPITGEVPSPVNPPSGCRFRTRCWKAEPICAEQVPELVVREAARHPSACHFAAETAEL